MKNINFIIMLIFLLSSCTTAEFIQHTPTLANSGQHSAKGEFTGKAMFSTGGSTANSITNGQDENPYERLSGMQAQGSYAVAKNLAVQGAFMYSDELGGSIKSGSKNIVYKYKRNMNEMGMSWFAPINKNKTFFFEMAGGAGFGKYKSTEAVSITVPGGRFYNHNVSDFFIQPSLYGISKNGNLYSAFGVKIANVHFSNMVTNYSAAERDQRDITNENKLNTQTLNIFSSVEVFTNKLPWLGISFQGMITHDMGQRYNLNFNNFNAGIGLCVKPGKKSKK